MRKTNKELAVEEKMYLQVRDANVGKWTQDFIQQMEKVLEQLPDTPQIDWFMGKFGPWEEHKEWLLRMEEENYKQKFKDLEEKYEELESNVTAQRDELNSAVSNLERWHTNEVMLSNVDENQEFYDEIKRLKEVSDDLKIE